MKHKITMRKQIIALFIFLITIPTVTIYAVASYIFIHSSENDLKNLYTANIREVGKNIDILFRNALDLTLYPLMEPSLKEYLTASPELPDYMLIKQNAIDILTTMPYGYTIGIHSIGLHTLHDDFIITNNNVKLTDTDRAALNNSETEPYWDYSRGSLAENYIYVSRNLKNPTKLSEYIGHIKLALSGSSIKESIMENQQNEQTSYFIITPDNEISTFTEGNQYSLQNDFSVSYEKLLELSKKSVSSQIHDQQIISAYPFESNDLILYSITQPGVFLTVKHSFLLNMAVISLFVIGCSVLLSIRFSNIITTPLKHLGTQMASLSNENFSIRTDIKGCEEISMLAEQFNTMAERLEFLYRQVYMGELKLKQSQLDMLQTQINPHFLYNTLDTIYWMSQMNDNKNVGIMISNLSQMMRMALAPKSNDKIPLSQELEHLACYLNIQKIRYGKKVDFRLNAAPELHAEYVLSFLLQPLVENALIHGLSSCTQGIVKIDIYAENDNIIYEVANDGVPINQQEIYNILKSREKGMKGFALRNINDRIVLKYGEDYSLTCYRKDTFSVFKIIQPKEN